LELEGYEVQAVVIPAAAVNAPHGRDRVWFVASHTDSRGLEGSTEGGRNGINVEWESKFGIIANTQFKSQGSNGGTNDETEGNIRRGNKGNVFGTLRGDGVIADTNSISNRGKSKQSPAAHKQGRSGKTNTGIGNEGEQQFVRDITGEGIDSNTYSVRLQHTEETRNIQESTRTTQSEGSELTESIETNGSDGNVTDTTSPGGGKDNGFGKSRFNDQTSAANGWDNFPTQSPICGGDDGLPTELDGITFSKWRNESIKAYGNAIVPQVAYQIFKAIQQTI
jgi:DNA (cytosine-5)-methyltransferase 1